MPGFDMKKFAFIPVFMLLFSSLSLSGEVAVKNNEKVAFLGDSITALGNSWSPYRGFIHLVIDGMKRCGITISTVRSGKGGHRSTHMLARVDSDVISKKPHWMLLSCGVNDVWARRKKQGVTLDQYKKNMTQIVEKAQKANIKVVIMTASMIGEDADNEYNKALKEYNDFLRSLAKEKKCLLADINDAMQKSVASKELSYIKGNKLTYDGVHMNGRGNIMMATVLLRTLGVPEAKSAEMKKDWEKKLPATLGTILLTQEQDKVLRQKAAEKGMSVTDYIASCLPVEKVSITIK